LPRGRTPSFNAINIAEFTWIDTLFMAEEGREWRRIPNIRGKERRGMRKGTSSTSSAKTQEASRGTSSHDPAPMAQVEDVNPGLDAPVDRGIALFARRATGVPLTKGDAKRLAAVGLSAEASVEELANTLFKDDAELLRGAMALIQSMQE